MPSGIKQIKAGPPYKPSKERELRDEMKAFMNTPEMVEYQYDKLFKVLAPEAGAGFIKNDLVEFLGYLESNCGFKSPCLPEAELSKLCKEASISEVKNNKACLTKFMSGVLGKQLDQAEGVLNANKKL